MASKTKRPRALDVVCFGEILWDIFERAPARPGEAIAREFRRELGGAPANVATTLARLGVASAVVGGIGLDKFGEALTQHLEADGVSTQHLIRLKDRTGLTFVTRDALGEPAFLFYRHETADVAVRAEHVTSEMGQAKWVLVGSSTMMTPTLAAATERFLAVAEQAGAHLVVDLNVREHLWASKAQMRDAVAQLVKRASIVKGSFADLVAITGRRDILWLADHAPKATWILTQGAKGASAIGNHGFVARPSLKAKCVDATGAGDAFIAGILAALLAANALPGTPAWKDERVWTRALEVGHQLGAKAVTGIGAVTAVVNLESVIANIARITSLTSPSNEAASKAPKRKSNEKSAAQKPAATRAQSAKKRKRSK